jgi:hypothetical protein
MVAAGDHLKTTILKDGVPTVVPDYATVSNLPMMIHQVL